MNNEEMNSEQSMLSSLSKCEVRSMKCEVDKYNGELGEKKGMRFEDVWGL